MAAAPGAQANPQANANNVALVNNAQKAAEEQAATLQAMGENHQRVMSLIAMLAELSKGLQQLWQTIAANMK
jgi:hypothetical protein